MYQKTLKSKINFKGIGLHSGLVANLVIKPSTANSGINFVRTDHKVKKKLSKLILVMPYQQNYAQLFPINMFQFQLLNI